MCEVSYGTCPDEVDCSGITPVTGTILLNLPGQLHCVCVCCFNLTIIVIECRDINSKIAYAHCISHVLQCL